MADPYRPGASRSASRGGGRGTLAGGVVVALLVALAGLVLPGRAEAAATPGGCDPLVGDECLLPFPNDWYTRADPHTDTGRRVAFRPGALPADALGVPVDPTPWNRSDGFSPGSTLTVRVPGVDLAASGAAPVTDLGASLRSDAPIVLLDTGTGQRWPYWAELDARATRADRQALLIHPARNLADGHHYAVALRGLRDTADRPIAPPTAFVAVAGHRLRPGDPLYARQRELAPTLATLARAGVGPAGLYLAWDFTVASSRNLTGELTAIRDDAFARLGDRAPAYSIGTVTDFDQATNPRIAREVTGTVAVPSYLASPGGPSGSVFARDARGRPFHLPGNTQVARFRCEIPRAAFTTPSRPALYGHGLLGSRDEVSAGNVQAMAAEHDFTFCATDWIGMAEDDILTVVGALTDINRFAAVPERSQQGILNAQFLGRDLVHRKGFTDSAAFRTAAGRPLLDPHAGLAYDGNSQGGILGGALVATSTDIRRGVLGVTGMNYSLLLDRSADFARFQPVLKASYPDKLRQQLVFDLLQMLWDRGETDGYAAHLTDRHQVLMHVAYGDHQVANVASEVEARTIGARLVTPALTAGRSPDRLPYWGIRPAGPLPYRGSALVVWDSGTPSPPTTNTAPEGSGYGHDPHSDPRNSVAARQQKATFLATGTVVDVCGGAPCTADPA